MRPSKQQLKTWLAQPAPVEDLRALVCQSPTTPLFMRGLRTTVDDLSHIPPTTYTRYRQFEHTGYRPGYSTPYFLKRASLTRAVLEFILGDDTARDAIHDYAWSICEETTWVLPAHEEQGPDYWDLDPPRARTESLGAHTMLTREPDSIDLFCAETGASLAEAVYLVGDELAPEVRQRIRHEVARRIFRPYLAYARDHWWFKGPLNWNGVCNGAIGMAFLRLENDLETLAEALALVLEGFEAYLATGFEADGGSIEGVGYWNYGLMYFIATAELLREMTAGQLDLLAQPRLKAIAAYPPGMALVPPDRFINFGDSTESLTLSTGVVKRLAERTGTDQLHALLTAEGREGAFESGHQASQVVMTRQSTNYYSKLVAVLRTLAWFDATEPVPAFEMRDFVLPDVGVVKLTGQTRDGRPVVLAAKSGHNDGHHSHTDIATFILNVGGDSLIPDAGRGMYSKSYFRQERYDNVFNNSYSHSVPRIAGQLQAPGPEFGGSQQFYGTIVEQGERAGRKVVVIDFHRAYDLPALTSARRTLALDPATGEVTLADEFAFDGPPLAVEEAFVTWDQVTLDGSTARIQAGSNALLLAVEEPAGAVFAAESLADHCRANEMEADLSRLTVTLPPGSTRFCLRLTPQGRA